MRQTEETVGFTPLGKIASFLLIAVLIGLGVWVFMKKKPARPADQGHPTAHSTAAAGRSDATGGGGGAERGGEGGGTAGGEPPVGLAATQTEVPKLEPAGAYQPRDNTIDLELSEYAGYAGLIVANGGLEPNADSVFARKHGFKVRIKLSEEESWSRLNSGKIAASATTADVLAVLGRQFQVVVPAQIGFSRGADGVIVRSGIRRINDLKGKTLAAAQFTEADFLIRYLAQEAGLPVSMLPDLNAPPDPEKLNLVFTSEGPEAGDVFLADLQAGGNRLAGCSTWAPKTTEVVEEAKGKARLLTTNRNLLIIADILIVNRAFAQGNPKMVAGLVDGLLEGNRMVRDNPAAHLGAIARAFNVGKDAVKDKDDLWDPQSTKDELSQVHLSNLPENVAFFRGEIDAAGSFGGIYQSAVYSYGPELIREPAPAERFVDLSHLQGLEKSGAYKDQKVAIAPIRGERTAAVEDNPLLSKDIRFYFMANSAQLDMTNKANLDNLDSIKELLQVSPGSTILLRGHVDDAQRKSFRDKGGPAFERQMAMKAMQLSKERADEVKKRLLERHPVEAQRLEVVGRGWDEPLGTDSEKNRRVEVQWFLIE